MPKSPMPEELRFCGRLVREDDLNLVREIVTDFKFPRSELTDTVCELLDWTRPNGKLKRVECLQFLEKLEEKGFLKLPDRVKQTRGAKKKPGKTEQGDRQEKLSCGLSVVKPVFEKGSSLAFPRTPPRKGATSTAHSANLSNLIAAQLFSP